MHDPLLVTYAQVTKFRKDRVLLSQVSMEKSDILIKKEEKVRFKNAFFPSDLNLIRCH